MEQSKKQALNMAYSKQLFKPTATSKILSDMACDLDQVLEENVLTLNQRKQITETIKTLETLGKELAHQPNVT